MDPNEFSQMNSEDETLPRLMFFGSFPSVHLGIYVQLWQEGDRKVAGRLEDGFFGWARDWGGMGVNSPPKKSFQTNLTFQGVFSALRNCFSTVVQKRVSTFKCDRSLDLEARCWLVDWLVDWVEGFDWIGWLVGCWLGTVPYPRLIISNIPLKTAE